MARQLNGTSQRLVFSAGDLAGVHDWGMGAVLVKRGATGGTNWHCPLYTGTGGNSNWGITLDVTASNVPWFGIGTGQATGSTALNSTSVWFLVVIGKASGNLQPRLHVLNLDTGVWAHSSLTAFGNATVPTVNQVVMGAFGNSGDWFNGAIAAAGVFRRWAPDDATVEALGLEDSAQAWVDAAANAAGGAAVWVPGQTATGTVIQDLTGGGANETSSGVGTVVAGPTGFTETIGGGGTAYEDHVETAITATTTRTDRLDATSPVSTTITATTSAADARAQAEELSTTITATTVATGSLGGHEDVMTAITATTATEDALDAASPAITTVTATTTATDLLEALEAVSTTVGATTSVGASVAAVEVLLTTAAATTSVEDHLAAVGAFLSTVAATTTVADEAALDDALLTLVTATTEVLDRLDGLDDVATLITATTTVLDTFVTPGAYEDRVETTITATTEAQDRLGAEATAVTSITAATSVLAQWTAEDRVLTTVLSMTSATSLVAYADDLATLVTATTTIDADFVLDIQFALDLRAAGLVLRGWAGGSPLRAWTAQEVIT